MHVQLTPHTAEDGQTTFWLVGFDGADPVAVADYAVQTDSDGMATLSVVLPIDSLTVGDPSLSQPSPALRPAAPEQPAPSTWGDPTKPDPREKITGWQPEKLGGQVAENAQQVHIQWAPSANQEQSSAFARLLRQQMPFVRLARQEMRRGGGTSGVLA